MVNGDLELFWGEMGVKPGEVPAYSPLKRNVGGMTFLTQKLEYEGKFIFFGTVFVRTRV